MLEGLPSNCTTYVMRLRCNEEAVARAVADIVVETFDPTETAAAAFDAASCDKHNAPEWRVEVFFGTTPDEASVRRLVAGVAGESVVQRIEFSVLCEPDWIAKSLEGLGAVRAGRFLVYGAHDRARAHCNDIALEIEAALAFGTGHHGTTRGCLMMLDRILKVRRPRRILDIGTGTGILAIAAARALRRMVVAGDIDPTSVATCRANAKQNGAGQWVRPVLARGLRHPALQANGPYDLIFANILARPLRLMSVSLAARATPRADIILSGLLAQDVAGILSAYATQNLRLVRRIDLDGWATLLLRRGELPRTRP